MICWCSHIGQWAVKIPGELAYWLPRGTTEVQALKSLHNNLKPKQWRALIDDALAVLPN